MVKNVLLQSMKIYQKTSRLTAGLSFTHIHKIYFLPFFTTYFEENVFTCLWRSVLVMEFNNEISNAPDPNDEREMFKKYSTV